MALELIGKKVKMGNVFMDDGRSIPVTFIDLFPLTVTQVKRADGPDGYSAIQVGYSRVAGHRLTRARSGHQKKIEGKPFKNLIEFRIDNPSSYEIGSQVGFDLAEIGDRVDVIGISKGRGFTGVVKRYNFRGAPASHGTSQVHRKPMSGGATDAARVFKGARKPGHMGAVNVTVKRLEIVLFDREAGIIALKGAVPGPSGGLIRIIPRS